MSTYETPPQEPDDEPRRIEAGDQLYFGDKENPRAWIQSADPQEVER